MSTVLLAEDEPEYRDLLAFNLTGEGYDVYAAATGYDAIAVGVRLRPEILVADWMLLDHIHGLHVAAALRAVDPHMRTILMTGFPSQDLRNRTAELPGCIFLAKPFRLETFLRMVAQTAAAPPLSPAGLPIAVAEIDAAGIIRYANDDAWTLFATTTAGRNVQSITDVVSMDTLAELKEGIGQWHEVVPRALTPDRWWVGVRPNLEANAHLLVIIPEGAEYCLYDPVLRLLLDLPTTALQWPMPGPALIIDDDPLWRRLAVNQLGLIGGVCHSTATHDEGLQLFARHPAISVVILADNRPTEASDDLAPLVTQLMGRRPAVCLIGTSPYDKRHAFLALDVPYFLRKPWQAADLTTLLIPEASDLHAPYSF
jgi:two-component system response regulator (stage 0 sporulation protein F)